MIDCLSDESRKELIGMGAAIDKAEKIFKRLISKHGLDEKLVKLIIMPDKAGFDMLKEKEPILYQTDIAASTHRLMISEDACDDSAIVKEVHSVIYIYPTTLHILSKIYNKSPRKFRFCIKYILGHEVGHVAVYHNMKDMTLESAKRTCMDMEEEFQTIKKQITSDTNGEVHRLDQFICMSNTDKEYMANTIAGHKDKDHIKFYKWFKQIKI